MKRYTYSTPSLLPAEFGHEWPGDDVVAAAGFAPDDSEVEIGRLTETWGGHPAGSIVISGLMIEGHPFTVLGANSDLVKCSICYVREVTTAGTVCNSCCYAPPWDEGP